MSDSFKPLSVVALLSLVAFGACAAHPESSSTTISSSNPSAFQASSPASLAFTPEVCFHVLAPPPCESPVVSSVDGILYSNPMEFEASYWGASIGHRPDGEAPDPNANPRIPGEYEALAWDSDGQLVNGVILELDWFGPEVDAEEIGAFVDIFLPGTSGVSRVEFRVNGETLYTWTAGPDAPEVASIAVTATESGGVMATWEADDPDGDGLVFSTSLIASDGKVSTSSLGMAGTTTILEAPEGNVGFPGPYRVRVMASDGINIAWAFSEEVEAENHAPEFWYDGPSDEPPVILCGSAYVIRLDAWDVEDGDLSDSVVWTSSIDGTIGTGFGLYINGYEVFTESRTGTEISPEIELSLGVHEFTATVTDSGGATATMVFVIDMRSQEDCPY